MLTKIDYEKLEKNLAVKKISCWEKWDEKTAQNAFVFAEGYKKFLDNAKTEREAVRAGVKLAEKAGFVAIKRMEKLKPGDKVYVVNREKNLFLIRLGKKKFAQGVKLLMAHIDSPRLDFKVTPLYEDENLAFFKTHYYGGIKKHQWPTIALAMHGVAYLADGKQAEIIIGEKETDPIFMITDLLPHLDRTAGPGSQGKFREVDGEDLNLLVGSIPVKAEKIKEKVKLAILGHLHDVYGLIEADLASADLCAVPSEKARDLGFDRSLISAYGQDDKICAYATLQSFLIADDTDQTQICAWVDKEEIGSEGNTSAQSMFLDVLISDMLELAGEKSGLHQVYKIFQLSSAVSADVTAGVDPDYKDVHDLRNAHRLGFGLALERYTGSGGKYDSSEASGEFIRNLRMIFSKNKNIVYQLGGGLGKVDKGGGGTIAKYLANRNLEIIDMGVPLFNMHAPLEIASKADLFSAYLGYRAFLEG
jgi:aspartyl aminopeptidase